MAAAAIARAPRPRSVLEDVLVRFDAAGVIRWMNHAARQSIGPSRTVLEAAISQRPLPALTRLPLGCDWLWWGGASGCSARRLRSRLGGIHLWLIEAYRRRESQNQEISRARGQIQARIRRPSLSSIQAAVEAERTRIARDLHDNASQSLTGILINLELARRHVGSSHSDLPVLLDRSREMVNLTMDQIRGLSHSLHLPEWSEQDFASALHWWLDKIGLRARMRVEVGPVDVPAGLPANAQTVLFRTLQEALTNVLRHSAAGRVRIQARREAGFIGLVVEDDGRGFDPRQLARGRGGIGLRNMRRRIEELGGRLVIDSTTGRGTRLSAFLPLGSG